MPSTTSSMTIVRRIEKRYRLPHGYLTDLLMRRVRAPSMSVMATLTPSDRRRLAWHLPDDFGGRSTTEQNEIIAWIRQNILSASTDYHRYQIAKSIDRYGLRFSSQKSKLTLGALGSAIRNSECPVAPPALQNEMDALTRFKSAELCPTGMSRNGTWNEATVGQRVEHLALMLGALCARKDSRYSGLGIDRRALSLGLLSLPEVWDWYLDWRRTRRGFFTSWEADMLCLGAALNRPHTGWLWQSPELAGRLSSIPGLSLKGDCVRTEEDWKRLCEATHRHCAVRAKEVKRVARIHRDPFETILPVLEAENPLATYLSIAAEIERRLPDRRRYPKQAAEAARSLLMLRLALHLGVRQKNLRQLLLQQPGNRPRSAHELERLRRGEIRRTDRGWEVFIPSVAFKNAGSHFFDQKPFRLHLDDVGGLYRLIGEYVERHRPALVSTFEDPGTFFVKSMKRTSQSGEYDGCTFYEAWRLMIQRYGIRNPFTGLGAIPGLKPHGPHAVRDVLATHLLKVTGSYEQASYAIQDTADTVSKHYARFLPQDKSALASKILNRVWSE